MFVISWSVRPWGATTDSLMFANKARAYLNEASFRCHTLGWLMALATKTRLGRQVFPGKMH